MNATHSQIYGNKTVRNIAIAWALRQFISRLDASSEDKCRPEACNAQVGDTRFLNFSVTLGILYEYTIIFLIFISIFILNSSPSFAIWPIYHKPEFKGKVIDAETKEPIEGAVVVVVYNKITYAIIEKIGCYKSKRDSY